MAEFTGLHLYGPLGTFCFALVCAIIWVVRTWRADIATVKSEAAAALKMKDDELAKEREAHQRTRDGHMTELRGMMKLADSVDSLRVQVARNASERSAA